MTVTFYSYKGGVGRTQLLANVAAYLCYKEHSRVLLIDWDLEAPGLHFYFKKSKLSHEGLMELLGHYVHTVKNKRPVQQSSFLNAKYIKRKYITSCCKPKGSHKGMIDIMPAGKYGEGYSDKINNFNWKEFYEALEGKYFIEYFKDELKKLDYDYILIDSRTGISDYSGINNIQMPDVNVLVTVPNEQNFQGTLQVAESIINSPYTKEYRAPIIIPILSRVDTALGKESYESQQHFIHKFGYLVKNLEQYMNTALTSIYLEETLVPYKSNASFGETVLFSEDTPDMMPAQSLVKPYANIGKFLSYLAHERFNKPKEHNDRSKDLNKLSTTIEHYIQQGKTNQAINMAIDFVKTGGNSEQYNHLMVLSAQFDSTLNRAKVGTISNDKISWTTSQINSALLSLVNELKGKSKS